MLRAPSVHELVLALEGLATGAVPPLVLAFEEVAALLDAPHDLLDGPVVALLGSSLQLGERPTPMEWAGMMLIAAALALISWDTIRRHRPSEPMMVQE